MQISSFQTTGILWTLPKGHFPDWRSPMDTQNAAVRLVNALLDTKVASSKVYVDMVVEPNALGPMYY